MKELNDIILAYNKAVLQNKQTALVTVVKVEGSSYRRPGAKMLVTEDGEITGAISGGCLEGDALRKAKLAMHQQQNKLEIYDTSGDDDNKFGIQLGCNGIVYILFEPIKNYSANNPISLIKNILSQRKNAVLVTLFNQDKNALQQGTSILAREDESFFADDKSNSFTEETGYVLQQKQSLVTDEKDGSALYQFIPPVIQLVIVGAGNDAQPLVEMASLLGWNIVVADGRPAYPTQQRFPKANKVCVVKPADILAVADIDEQTAVVLMTHNYNYELTALAQLIDTNCHYVGVLGPKKKLYKIFDELTERGFRINDKTVHKIFGPVGLDIGAETAEEIALSVVAEIKAVFSNRNGTSLKNKKLEIHERLLISHHE